MISNNVRCIIMALVCCASLHAAAAPKIYEPFAQTAGDLNGKAGGTGLGNWTADASIVTVANPPTLSYGSLPNSGGQGNLATSGGTDARVTTTSVLLDNNLLANGSTLWFSTVFMKTAGGGPNEWAGFAFGTSYVLGQAGGLNMQSSGNGVGFVTRDTSATVTTWLGGGNASQGSGVSVTYSTPLLIVGKIQWGAADGDVETITLYKRDLSNLGAPLGAGVSKTVAGFDQTALNVVSFSQRDSGGVQTYDEIRLGGSYLDVIGGSAAESYWDVDGATPGAGGASPAGTWDASTTANWSSDSTGASAATMWPAGGQAVFAAGTNATGNYTVTVNGTPVIGGLTFEEGTVTVSGGTALDLVSAGGFLEVRRPTGTATVATPITQTTPGGSLYKEGAGTLTLSGNNTYGCPTIVNAGTLILSGDNSGAALELTNNITIGGEALTLSGNGISSSGALRSISGSNTYGGVINLAANARISSDSGSLLILDVASGDAITNTANLSFGGAGDIRVADPIAIGTGSLTRFGAGTLELWGSNTYSGVTTVTNSTITGVTGGSCDNSDVVLNANGRLGIHVTDNTKQWSCKSVTVSTATGTKLKFAFDLEPSISLAPLKILNNLTFTGKPTVEVDPTNLKKGYDYPLLVVVGTPPAPDPLPALSGIDGKLTWNGNTLYLNCPLPGMIITVR